MTIPFKERVPKTVEQLCIIDPRIEDIRRMMPKMYSHVSIRYSDSMTK